MDSTEFERIFEETIETSRKTLFEKAREYAYANDRMHNFHKASVLIDGTPEQALWGFVVKHLVSLSDMIESGQNYPDAVWEEKIGDSLNYLILLRALVKEESKKWSAMNSEK